MKTILILAASSVLLSGCGTSGVQRISFTEALKEMASDPHCGHIDRLQGNLGGLTGNNLSVYLERTCPAQEPAIVPLSRANELRPADPGPSQ